MVKKRGEQQPWMSAPDYGRSLRGLSINLLVKDVARAIAFAREVLGATLVYGDGISPCSGAMARNGCSMRITPMAIIRCWR